MKYTTRTFKKDKNLTVEEAKELSTLPIRVCPLDGNALSFRVSYHLYGEGKQQYEYFTSSVSCSFPCPLFLRHRATEYGKEKLKGKAFYIKEALEIFNRRYKDED